MTKNIREHIIQELATGEFVSGQQLGDDLGISRAAVSKHIKAINNMGLDVFRITGKGYRLPQPILLLSEQAINRELNDESVKVEVHSLIDSTNTYLLGRINEGLTAGHSCIAEYQSAGRGRRGKQWLSPFGSHIYFSMYWPLHQGMQAAMGLSLTVGLAICDTLSTLLGIHAEVKWPNDIYIGGKKVAGILVELEGHSYETSHAIIGVGLNVSMPSIVAKSIDQPWTDIGSHYAGGVDRNVLTAQLIKDLQKRLKRHCESGLNDMLQEWHEKDFFYNKPVKIIAGEQETTGICRGINSQGALLLEVNNKIEPIYGGEVSLRGNE